MNYSNNDKSSPFKKGRLKDIVKPKRYNRHTRVSFGSDKDVIDELVIDLVQVLADFGIIIKNVHTLARSLVRLGWIKSKKIKG